MKKTLILTLAVFSLLAVTFPLYSNGGGEDTSGMSVLNWNLGADPKTLDPVLPKNSSRVSNT